MHPVKGADVLLNACQKLKECGIPFELFIAGDGELLDNYKKLAYETGISDVVHFLGWIDDKKSFFETVDILCIPSRSEAQSLSLLEGLSYAKPVVISDCPGMLEVIENNQCGLSFPIENSKTLFDRLSVLIQDAELCRYFSKNSYNLFLKKYNEDVQSQNLKIGMETVLRKM